MKILFAVSGLALIIVPCAIAANPADAAKQQSAESCQKTEKAAYDHFDLGGVYVSAGYHSGPNSGVGGDLVRPVLEHHEAYEKMHAMEMSNINHCEALESDGPPKYCGEEHYQQEMKLAEAGEVKEAAAYCSSLKEAYARFQELKATSKRVCGILRPTPMIKRVEGQFKAHAEYCKIISK